MKNESNLGSGVVALRRRQVLGTVAAGMALAAAPWRAQARRAFSFRR